MPGRPCVVTLDTTFPWDRMPQRLRRGDVLDVQPGSALEAAIGRDRLVPVHGAPEPPEDQPPAGEQPAAPDTEDGDAA